MVSNIIVAVVSIAAGDDSLRWIGPNNPFPLLAHYPRDIVATIEGVLTDLLLNNVVK